MDCRSSGKFKKFQGKWAKILAPEFLIGQLGNDQFLSFKPPSNFIFKSLGWWVKGECGEMGWELGGGERKSVLLPEPYKSMPGPATGSKFQRWKYPCEKRLFIFFMDFPKAKSEPNTLCEVFFSVLDKKALQKPWNVLVRTSMIMNCGCKCTRHLFMSLI